MKRMIGIVLGVSAVVSGGIAYAGYISPNGDVSVSSWYGNGALGKAHHSADSTQMIGCYNTSYANGSPSRVTCYARNAAGTYKSCYTESAALIATARSAASDSSIGFNVNTDGQCTMISVETSSAWVVK
jgi:hypothetical protein